MGAVVAVLAAPIWAQQPADPSAAVKPAPSTINAQPDVDDAETEQAPAAVVIEVSGTVHQAKAGVSPLADEGWTAVKLNDRLAPGVQIRTGLRSYVNLAFGETTTISIRRATYAGIDQFYRAATEETVRIGLGYGTVRGGSTTEGTIRSAVTVDSPVATLVKRGTDGWQMFVESGTGRFNISLARHGLVDAIQKLRARRSVSRSVRPGEYATERNIANMWINQNIFDRVIRFYEAQSVTVADAEFSAAHTRGYGTLAPGGGTDLLDLAARSEAAAAVAGAAPNTLLIEPDPLSRPEGNFGTPSVYRLLVPQRAGH